MDQNKIRPCPFCTEPEPHLIVVPFQELRPDKTGKLVRFQEFESYVMCRHCLAKGPIAPTKKQAIYLWNHPGVRAKPSDVPNRVPILRHDHGALWFE